MKRLRTLPGRRRNRVDAYELPGGPVLRLCYFFGRPKVNGTGSDVGVREVTRLVQGAVRAEGYCRQTLAVVEKKLRRIEGDVGETPALIPLVDKTTPGRPPYKPGR
jgi:hypothetical protein